VGENSALYYL